MDSAAVLLATTGGLIFIFLKVLRHGSTSPKKAMVLEALKAETHHNWFERFDENAPTEAGLEDIDSKRCGAAKCLNAKAEDGSVSQGFFQLFSPYNLFSYVKIRASLPLVVLLMGFLVVQGLKKCYAQIKKIWNAGGVKDRDEECEEREKRRRKGAAHGRRRRKGAVHGRRRRKGAVHGRRRRKGAAHGRRRRKGAAHGRRRRKGAAHGKRRRKGAAHGKRRRKGAAHGRRRRKGAARGRRRRKGLVHGRRRRKGAAHGRRRRKGAALRRRRRKGAAHGRRRRQGARDRGREWS